MLDSRSGDTSDFVTWLTQNIDSVRNGAGSYKGERVTLNSEVCRYFTCFSLVFFTTRTITPYFLQGSDAEKKSAVTAFLITALLGWWGFPFGVIFTPYYLVKNAMGGEKTTVENVIKLIENPAEAVKANDAFRYGPFKIILGIFGAIIGLMIAMQAYLIFSGKAGHTDLSSGKNSQHRAKVMAPFAPTSTDPTTAFIEEVQYDLKRAWHPPRSNESSRIVVRFGLDKRRIALKPRIVKASSNSAQNVAAMKAIVDAAPFPPLPAVLDGKTEIEFTFDYNVWQHGDKVPFDSSKEPGSSDK